MKARPTETDRRQGERARKAGVEAWRKSRDGSPKNPYAARSFVAACWAAGYWQSVQSIDEIFVDWTKS